LGAEGIGRLILTRSEAIRNVSSASKLRPFIESHVPGDGGGDAIEHRSRHGRVLLPLQLGFPVKLVALTGMLAKLFGPVFHVFHCGRRTFGAVGE
jgi:hypothetical protein